LFASALTTAVNLHDAPALASDAYPAIVLEFALAMSFVWVLSITPEPLV